jgi:hypothetical protein
LEYEKKAKELEKSSFSKEEGEKMIHKQKINHFAKQINILKEEIIILKEDYKKLNDEKENKTKEIEEIEEKNQFMISKIDEFNKSHDPNDPDLIKLKSLVSLNELLKKQEELFRETCKKEIGELKELISSLEASQSSDEIQKYNELDNLNKVDVDKLNKLKKLSLKRNKEISLLQRKIDDIPTRTEIIQYEKRFKELYEQIILNLDSTKKYFEIYNTLTDVFNCYKKEINLINIVFQNYEKTKTQKLSKEIRIWLTNSILDSLKKINQSKIDSENDLKNCIKKRDLLNDEYDTLISQQRNYFNDLKDFQIEISNNETLLKAIKILKSN